MGAAMDFDIPDHRSRLTKAFVAMLKAEDAVADVKKRKSDTETALKQELSARESELAETEVAVRAILAETGEVEVILPGDVTDFKLGYGTVRESVKADPAATPDRFCKIERKPMLKEIGEHLRSLPEAERPNWASIEAGEPKFSWKAIKKSNNRKESA